MKRYFPPGVLMLFATALPAVAQQGAPASGRVVLSQLNNGSSVAFFQAGSAGLGIDVAGQRTARFSQQQPVWIELYRSDTDIKQLAAGYNSVRKQSDGVTAQAKVDGGNGVAFTVTDQWSAKGDIVSLNRKVVVSGTADSAGFYTAIRLHSDPDLTWPDVNFLAPSLLYGDTTYNGRGPGGVAYDRARRYSFREDYLPAPLFAVSLRNGDSLTILDQAPQGHTTTQEATVDERFSFGGFGADETADGGFEMGYWLPGTTVAVGAPGGRGAAGGGGYFGTTGGRGQTPQTPQPGPPQPVQLTWTRRYNPVKEGFTQSYQLGFRFGSRESFPDLIRNSYRWAWQVLKPAVNWQDMEVVRRSLVDQLSSQVYTIEGRTGLPFIVSTVTGKVFSTNPDPNFFWRATMGFVGKNLEAADQLLRESDRDPSARGQKMRQQGLDTIATFIRLVPMSPPVSTGVNLKTGAPSMTNSPQWFIREATDDMRMVMEAYDRERKAGRDHPEWIRAEPRHHQSRESSASFF